MPQEPIREKVMAAMRDRLATITAGVTYWTSPSLVTRELLWITQYNQPLIPPGTATQLDAGPVLGCMRASGSQFERLTHPKVGHVAESFEHFQRVTVWGFAKKTDTVIVGTLIERLWQDHLGALLADPSLGGLATLPIVPDGDLDTDDGALEPLAYFAQDWLIRAA